MGVKVGSSDIAKPRHASGLGKGKKGGTRANTGKMRRTAPQGTCLEIRLVLVRAIGRSSNSGRQQVSETMTSTQSIIGRKTAGLHVLGMDGLIQWNQGHQWSGLNGIKGINGVRLTATAVVGVSRVQEQVGRRRLTPLGRLQLVLVAPRNHEVIVPSNDVKGTSTRAHTQQNGCTMNALSVPNVTSMTLS